MNFLPLIITVLIGLIMLAVLLMLFIRMGKNETLDDDNPEKMWFAKTTAEAAPAAETLPADADDSSAPLPPLTEEEAAQQLQQLREQTIAEPTPQPQEAAQPAPAPEPAPEPQPTPEPAPEPTPAPQPAFPSRELPPEVMQRREEEMMRARQLAIVLESGDSALLALFNKAQNDADRADIVKFAAEEVAKKKGVAAEEVAPPTPAPQPLPEEVEKKPELTYTTHVNVNDILARLQNMEERFTAEESTPPQQLVEHPLAEAAAEAAAEAVTEAAAETAENAAEVDPMLRRINPDYKPMARRNEGKDIDLPNIFRDR